MIVRVDAGCAHSFIEASYNTERWEFNYKYMVAINPVSFVFEVV